MGQQQLLDDLANKTGGDGQDLVAARLSLLYKEVRNKCTMNSELYC